jgi:hypothetical protein
MIRRFSILSGCAALLITGCSFGGPVTTYPQYRPTPGQGQYIRPAYLNAQPTPRVPPVDACRSQLYQGLLGQHEGAIFVAGLPGRKRVIKPAQLEGFGYNPDDTFYDEPPFMQVTEYLPGQSLYAPAISNMTDRLNLGPEVEERLTIELDAQGYIQTVDCR